MAAGYKPGLGVSAPRELYAPDPEYSEEARRAKFQGSVLLWMVVGSDGLPRDIKVVRSVGLGLDEKALEAVRTGASNPDAKMANLWPPRFTWKSLSGYIDLD